MKNTLSNTFKAVGAVVLFASLAFTACKKDEREKFIGTYNVVESCTSGNFSYQMTINESNSGDDAVLLVNFGNFSQTSFSGTISGSNITIPNQTVNVGGTTVVGSGSGALNGSILTIAYTYSVGGQSDNCTATCTKL